MPPDPRWKAHARDALPSDVLRTVEIGLKPFVEGTDQSLERSGKPKISAGDLPLAVIRFILLSPSDTRPHRKNEVLLTERIIDEFATARGGKATFFYSPPPEQAFVERIAKAQGKSNPVEIMRGLILDRQRNASVADRQTQLVLQADWRAKTSLDHFGLAALLGIEETLIDEIVSTEMLVSVNAAADKTMPILSESPALILLAPAASLLGESNNLLIELQRRGFIIEPISLGKAGP
jgi:hypothetical protein